MTNASLMRRERPSRSSRAAHATRRWRPHSKGSRASSDGRALQGQRAAHGESSARSAATSRLRKSRTCAAISASRQRDLVTMIENTKVLVAAIEGPGGHLGRLGGARSRSTRGATRAEFKGRVTRSRRSLPTRTRCPERHQGAHRDPELRRLLKRYAGYAKIKIDERPVGHPLQAASPLVAREVWSWLP